MLVESLNPPDEDDFYGNIEEIENLEKFDPDMGLNTGSSVSEIDKHVLSLAETELDNMIEPFEEALGGVPWVKVSGLHIFASVPSARSN